MTNPEKKPTKFYQSKVDYSKKYNASLSTIQISKELHSSLKDYLNDKDLTIRQWIEDLIRIKIDER